MASPETLQKLAEHPEWLPPRSDLRVFLGQPGAPEAVKTTVEPGNVFSPGMLTFGVTWWLRFPATGAFFATETAPLEDLHWRFDEGYLPVLRCSTQAGGLAVEHTLFQDGDCTNQSEATAARLALNNPTPESVSVQVFVALRSLGPVGGPLPDLRVGADRRSWWLVQRSLPLLVVDSHPDAIGCGVGDPSPLALAGEMPSDQQVGDPAGWCYGLLRCDITLVPGQVWQLRMDCPQQSYGMLSQELPGTARPQPSQFEARLAAHADAWRERFAGLELDVPDDDFRGAFYASLVHLLTAMVGDQARIAALSYPLPWLRDSIFIMRCLDLAGFHDLARAATNYVARNDFFGGFGAEGDAPGEGLWALVQHYRITRDHAWLASVYPAIERKVDWLRRMRRAQHPIQVFVDTPTLAFTHGMRASGVICLPAKDGLIQGSMDGGIDFSLGWVNHWAIGGLREAGYAAAALGQVEEALAFAAEAQELELALRRYARQHQAFFSHERTVNSLVWPTRAWVNDLPGAAAGFNAWYTANRQQGGVFQPEPYWLYFESSQAHNALLFGQRERAWQVVDYRLRRQDLPGLYGWREGGNGVGTENATRGVTVIPLARGCQRYDSITPHGWSQAELWLLQRALLVEEWGDGLLLFAGVPAHWLAPGQRVAFRGFPTWYGKINASLEVSKDGHSAALRIGGIEPGTPLTIRLPGQELVLQAGTGEITAQITL